VQTLATALQATDWDADAAFHQLRSFMTTQPKDAKGSNKKSEKKSSKKKNSKKHKRKKDDSSDDDSDSDSGSDSDSASSSSESRKKSKVGGGGCTSWIPADSYSFLRAPGFIHQALTYKVKNWFSIYLSKPFVFSNKFHNLCGATR
jgi:hypothetical protein